MRHIFQWEHWGFWRGITERLIHGLHRLYQAVVRKGSMMRKNEKQRPRQSRHFVCAQRRQLGVYAVEFAIVFPIFFLLFYGVLTFGLIFTAQQSLTLAAEDGARATLRYQMTSTPASGSVMMAQLRERLALACQVATSRMSWLSSAGAAVACQGEVRGLCANADGTLGSGACTATFVAGIPSANVFCGYLSGQQCLSTLTLTYGYGAAPLVPTIPGIGVIVPTTLRGVATVTLDPAMLQRLGSGA